MSQQRRLKGTRVSLRPTESEDLAFLQKLWNDAAVMRYVGYPEGLGIDEQGQVYFLPSSLPLLLRSKNAGWRLPYLPRLAKKDLAVRINSQEVPIKGLHRFQAWVGKGMDYPAHMVELPLGGRDPCRPTLIQVEARTTTRGRGEAWYIAW